MAEPDDYRRCAVDAFQLAQRALSNEQKLRLLKLAGAWLDLSEQAYYSERRSRKPNNIDPLTREKQAGIWIRRALTK